MLKRQNGIRTAITLVVVACALQTQFLPRLAIAAGTSVVTESAMSADVGLLENRFFSRQYANDPIEKRLERLELLVFGGTQDGDNAQRYARLKKAVADRAERAAKAAKPAAKEDAAKDATAKDDKVQSSSQYPILNTLEWRALKKTYPNESLDERLGRMEKKLFGADNPSMAYVDRVDRLKRTLGVGVTAQQPSGPLGPAPKARPRGQEQDFFGFGAPPMTSQGDSMDDDSGLGMGMPHGMFGLGMSNALSSLLKDMDRQMQQMQQLEHLPPGAYTYDPKSGAWVDQFSGKKVKPGIPVPNAIPSPTPNFKTPNIAPKVLPNPFQGQDSELPPYSDPNSI